MNEISQFDRIWATRPAAFRHTQCTKLDFFSKYQDFCLSWIFKEEVIFICWHNKSIVKWRAHFIWKDDSEKRKNRKEIIISIFEATSDTSTSHSKGEERLFHPDIISKKFLVFFLRLMAWHINRLKRKKNLHFAKCYKLNNLCCPCNFFSNFWYTVSKRSCPK